MRSHRTSSCRVVAVATVCSSSVEMLGPPRPAAASDIDDRDSPPRPRVARWSSTGRATTSPRTSPSHRSRSRSSIHHRRRRAPDGPRHQRPDLLRPEASGPLRRGRGHAAGHDRPPGLGHLRALRHRARPAVDQRGRQARADVSAEQRQSRELRLRVPRRRPHPHDRRRQPGDRHRRRSAHRVVPAVRVARREVLQGRRAPRDRSGRPRRRRRRCTSRRRGRPRPASTATPSGDLPTSNTPSGGCDGKDATGAPLATDVSRRCSSRPAKPNALATPSADREGPERQALRRERVQRRDRRVHGRRQVSCATSCKPPAGETLGAEAVSRPGRRSASASRPTARCTTPTSASS